MSSPPDWDLGVRPSMALDAGFADNPGDRAAPFHKSYGSLVSFEDPDGTGWLVQEIATRLPGQ